VNPDQPNYLFGDTVIVTAVPDSGLVLLGWSGDLTGKANPDTVVMTMNTNITATFGPLSYTLDAIVTGNGTVTKSPDQTNYSPGEQVILTAVADSAWAFAGWTQGLGGFANPETVIVNSDTTVTARFIFDSGIESDDFSSTTLDTSIWTFVDPVGDASLLATGTNLLMDVPGGTLHDVWANSDRAPRLLQTTADSDFEVEIKFDSIVEVQTQIQGIIAADGINALLRFDVHHNGTDVVLFAGFVNGGGSGTVHISATESSVPAYLKVARTGDNWEFRYSFDGVNWLLAGSFMQAITVNHVGFFGGNSNSNRYVSPSHVLNADYFFNTASPIIPEDGGSPTAPSPPTVVVWNGDNQDFGQLGNPQTLIQVMGRVWDTDALSAMSFTLNGGPSTPLNFGPDGLRLQRRGDYNLEIDNGDLLSGANQIVITAIDTLGEQTDETVTVNYTPGVVWSLPDSIDWSSSAKVTDLAQVVDGRWHLNADGVRTDSSATGYDRLLVVGDYTWLTNYEVEVPILIHSEPAGGVGLAFGWQGHTGPDQPKLGHPYQAIGWIVGFQLNPKLQLLRDGDAIQQETPVTVTQGKRYIMKMRSQAIGGGQSDVRLKLWEDGTLEPPGWDLIDNFTTLAGSVLLIAHYADVTFGDVSITPLSGQFNVTTAVVGNGSVTLTPDLPAYTTGDTVLVTALPDTGWSFGGWSGGLSGIENPDTIIVMSDSSVTATFNADLYTIATGVVGNGSVDRVPDLVNYTYGDTVLITATPDPGWTFTGWSGGLAGNENPDTIIVRSDTTATATFTQDQYVLTPSVVGNGALNLVPNLPNYLYGDTVFVTAVPDSGWLFTGWSGGLAGAENPDTIVVISDSTVTANFSVAHILTISIIGNGTVQKSPDQATYANGQQVTVTAIPDSGWALGSWSGPLTGAQNPDSFIVSSDTTLTATFLAEEYSVTINIVGDGTVQKTPDKPLYAPGEQIILQPIPDSGQEFVDWSGDLTGTESPDTVMADSSMTITATFQPTATGIEDLPPVSALEVRQNAPNPFSGQTQIFYSLPRELDVDIEIFDVAGRRVYSKRVTRATQGWNAFVFDGRDASGRRLATGVYFYRIKTLEAVVTRKMVITR